MTRWIFLDNQNEHTFYLLHDMDIAMTISGQNHPMMMTLLREIFHKDESNVGQTPFHWVGNCHAIADATRADAIGPPQDLIIVHVQLTKKLSNTLRDT
jgi:hypothetical protein